MLEEEIIIDSFTYLNTHTNKYNKNNIEAVLETAFFITYLHSACLCDVHLLLEHFQQGSKACESEQY